MRRWILRWLVIAVAVLIVSTVALSMLLSRAAVALTATDRVISRRAAPSIVALQAMRADVQEERTLDDEWLLGGAGDAAVRAARMDAVRRELDDSRRAYLDLPPERGEAPLRKALITSLDRFDLVIDRVRALPPGAAPMHLGLVDELDDAAAHLGDDLSRATDFSADVAKAAAADAIEVSRTLLPTAVVLDVVSAVAAIGTIALTYRSVRRAREMAQRSRQALEEKAQELDAFAGRVAHDLLSPLTAIGLGLDIARRRAGATEDPAASAAISRASATLQRVRGFVVDLLEFARAGARPPPGVRTHLEDVVGDVTSEFEPIARQAGVELQVEPMPDRDVSCSPGVLTSLLSNLVQNAIKYVAESEVRRVVVRASDLGEEVRVEVEDTGPGIEPPDQEKLFDPFVRGRGASGPGVGLGLATVRRLAEAHGGHVGIRSERGHGSVFWFSVPTAA